MSVEAEPVSSCSLLKQREDQKKMFIATTEGLAISSTKVSGGINIDYKVNNLWFELEDYKLSPDIWVT